MNDLRAHAIAQKYREEHSMIPPISDPEQGLRRLREALKPLLDKLDALEAQHGAGNLPRKFAVLTNVGVLEGIRAVCAPLEAGEGERADG